MEPIQTSERESLKQMMIRELKQYIMENELKAGDKLPTERKLTELFGVSRSVVREALSYLENVGILYVRQGQGSFLQESNIENLLNSFFFLWKINNHNVEEILSLRIIFESHAIDDIIQQRSEDAILGLQNLLDETADLIEVADRREADIQFHQALLRATNNSLLIQMTNVISHYFFQMEHVQLTDATYRALMEEHQDIVNAMKENDAMTAKKLLTAHIQN